MYIIECRLGASVFPTIRLTSTQEVSPVLCPLTLEGFRLKLYLVANLLLESEPFHSILRRKSLVCRQQKKVTAGARDSHIAGKVIFDLWGLLRANPLIGSGQMEDLRVGDILQNAVKNGRSLWRMICSWGLPRPAPFWLRFSFFVTQAPEIESGLANNTFLILVQTNQVRHIYQVMIEIMTT